MDKLSHGVELPSHGKNVSFDDKRINKAQDLYHCFAVTFRSHWYLKSIHCGFSRAVAPYLQKMDFVTTRVDNQKYRIDSPWDTKRKVFRGQLQIIAHLFGHQVQLSLI